MDWILKDIDQLWKVTLSSLLIITAIVTFVRIAGLRTFSKMTSFDFAVTIAIGSIIGSTASGSTALLAGTLSIGVLIAIQAIVAILIRKYEQFKGLATNQPLLIMEKEHILSDNLKYARMDEGQLMAKLREANVTQLSQVFAVILESTGDVSVLHATEENATFDMDEWLLKDVRRKP